MDTLLYIIFANFVISLGGLVGVFTLSIKESKLSRILMLLVSLSAGALMGGAFLHLLPEAVELLDVNTVFTIVLISFVTFFFIEKLLHWRHCHKGHCDVHTFGSMNLIGDSIHNFIDGLIIAATFLTDIRLGIVTTLTVALHEIPQEIGDFGVLLYSGFGKKKALIANFLVALIAIFGGVVGYFLSFYAEHFITYLLPFAAGGFIYIAASDLMPEIRKEQSLKKSIVSFGFFLLGIGIMVLTKKFGAE
ncbi:MAG: ZIP family metal transporter [Candidatus Gottesmanbacteria bacterium]